MQQKSWIGATIVGLRSKAHDLGEVWSGYDKSRMCTAMIEGDWLDNTLLTCDEEDLKLPLLDKIGKPQQKSWTSREEMIPRFLIASTFIVLMALVKLS